MVCAPVRSIIPSLKLGDYLSVQAHKPCSISHLSISYSVLFLVTADGGHLGMPSCKKSKWPNANIIVTQSGMIPLTFS